MTRTERAWELVTMMLEERPYLAGTDFVETVADAFDNAKLFETEAAKHEEPKAEGEVWYAVAELEGDGVHVETSHSSRKEAAQSLYEMDNAYFSGQARDRYSPYFLVEVRRVK